MDIAGQFAPFAEDPWADPTFTREPLTDEVDVAGTDYCRRTGFEPIGRDGMTLTERWRDGVRTFQGLCANGFRPTEYADILESWRARGDMEGYEIQ